MLHSFETLPFLHGLDDSPPLLLKILELSGRLDKLPRWVLYESMTHLRKLFLYDSELDVDDIKLLGTVPNLIRLTLRCSIFRSGTTTPLCFAAGELPSLQTLRLDRTNTLSVSFQEGTLPDLEFLYITGKGTHVSGIDNL